MDFLKNIVDKAQTPRSERPGCFEPIISFNKEDETINFLIMGTREIENPDEEQIMMDFESIVNILTLLTLEIRHDESFLVSIYENLRFPILEAFKIFLENKNTSFSIYLHYKGKEEQELKYIMLTVVGLTDGPHPDYNNILFNEKYVL